MSRSTGIGFLKSKILELDLSTEEKERLDMFLHNVTGNTIGFDEPVDLGNEFSDFDYFPGTLCVFDKTGATIYQNEELHGVRFQKMQGFANAFGKEAYEVICKKAKEVWRYQKDVSFVTSDLEGRFYDVKCSFYTKTGEHILYFFSPNRHLTIKERANADLSVNIAGILKHSNLNIEFYLWENNRFEPAHYDIYSENSIQEEKHVEIDLVLKTKMQESLRNNVVKVYQKTKEQSSKTFTRQIIIPLSSNSVCLVSEKVVHGNTLAGSDLLDKYKLVANNLTDLFLVVDENLDFTFVAPSVESALGFKYTELVGKNIEFLVPDWSNFGLALSQATEKNIDPEAHVIDKFNLQLATISGDLKWFEVQMTAIYNRGEVLQGHNLICRDISERIKYEEALIQAKQRAEESDNLKSAFLANMSHEIRTPLNGIIGFSSMLNTHTLDTSKRELYAQYIINSSKQLLTLINDIIDISKIEAGQLSIQTTPVHLNKMMYELLETVKIERARMGAMDIKLQLLIPDEDLGEIDTDEIRLKQVLINLLSNALKFTPGGQVEYGYEYHLPNVLRFFVRDTGTGISPEMQIAIFERFRQGEVDKQAKVIGTGLGLAISKGIIELLGGSIGVKSELNRGSEFYFTLPVSRE